MRVHLLATVRKEELLPAATMVFQTLRLGFPNAEIKVAYNNLSVPHAQALDDCLKSARAEREPLVGYPHNHHEWIGALLTNETEPFWICDTDIVFWNSVEDWNFGNAPLAGRYTPQFMDKFANAITRPRLHTSLLKINPVSVREIVERYAHQFPDVYCTPRPALQDLISPRYIPTEDGKTWFYDTCSLLFHAIGGRRFTHEQLDFYDHIQFGTLSDLVAPCYPEYRWRETQFAIFENHELARGSWKTQDEFYRKHAC